ncbi:MAG: HD family phosphohydrolase, partial [Cellulosilyticaceae bacterium]
GFLDEEDESNAIQLFGLLMFMLLMVLFLSRYFNEHKVLGQLKFRQTSLIFIVYMLSLVIVRLFMPLEVIYIPLSIGAMLMAILIKKEIAIIMHLILVIISAIACKGDIIFILYILMTGVIGIMIVASMQQRKQTMKCALLVGALHMLIYISLNLVVGVDIEPRLLIRGGQAFAVGLVEVVLVVGSLPLWEAAFGFITPIQLLELTNPNQPVLKRLLIEATGTYYHSLLVANLAEAAASDIGANTLLTRVGGYYHDIGKLQSSNYFKENQVRDNPHDYMDPKSSCDIILSHVTSGVEIAETYKLPKCVKDMIRQHHGTGIIQFFYVKAKEMDEEVLLKDFQYPGPKPQTREAALIMLADVVEATVRAMQHKIGTEVSVEDVVRKMVKQKLDEGQLDECPLYISDIEKIIHSFTHMLKGMYHERIEYPEKKG